MSRILISCIHYPIASGRYMARALRRLGHDVRTVGPTTGDEIWGIRVAAKYIWQPNMSTDSFVPDLWIHADSAYAPEADWHPLVLWGMDNHVRDYEGRGYDALFLAHSWGARMSEPHAHWLPPCYDPEAHFNLGLARDLDVAFCGVAYAERVEVMQKMVAAGLKCAAQTGLLFDEYNAIYNRAKVALCQSIKGDIPLRVFENMAQGCCVLADYQPDLIKLGFEPYQHFWLYHGAEDAVASAKWLIESGEWERIAARGQAKAKAHTWDNRAEQLLRTMELSREPSQA